MYVGRTGSGCWQDWKWMLAGLEVDVGRTGSGCLSLSLFLTALLAIVKLGRTRSVQYVGRTGNVCWQDWKCMLAVLEVYVGSTGSVCW